MKSNHIIRAYFQNGFFAVLLMGICGCSRSPNSVTVRKLVSHEVKTTLSSHGLECDVRIESYQLGEPYYKATARHPKKMLHYPCKAMYETTDTKGNVNKDVIWIGTIYLDEFGDWRETQ